MSLWTLLSLYSAPSILDLHTVLLSLPFKVAKALSMLSSILDPFSAILSVTSKWCQAKEGKELGGDRETQINLKSLTVCLGVGSSTVLFEYMGN